MPKATQLNIELQRTTAPNRIRLRYWPEGNTAATQERFLDYSEIQKLVQLAESEYFKPRVEDLIRLGRQLYDWLDAEDRFLQRAIQEAETNQLLTLAFQGSPELIHLPWELLHTGEAHLVQLIQPQILPVRLLPGKTTSREAKKRALHLLFMATSPEQVRPELNYEAEEASILEATSQLPLHLVVEESGNLEQLGLLMNDYGPEYFDVVHLSGHAQSDYFITEDAYGARKDASANDLYETFRNSVPPLLFLSGCHTGAASEQGNVPSLSEALVRSGFPAVMGWARPVLDRSASEAARLLYTALSRGMGILQAVRITISELLLMQQEFPGWHLLRVYLNGSLPQNLIVQGSYPKPKISLETEFLDPLTQEVKVPSRYDFIGRRRKLQHCLRVLRKEEKAGVVIYGMGGLGKSCLAARLRTRLHDTHQPVVWVGELDQSSFERKLTEHLETAEQRKILQSADEALRFRLREIFKLPSEKRLLFILDDFEKNMERDAEGKLLLNTQGKPRLTAQAVALLDELVAAIQSLGQTKGPQLIITCRYALEAGAARHLEQIPLTHFRDSEWDRFRQKKGLIREEDQRERIERIADGNPRLYEWLLKVVQQNQDKDTKTLLDKLEKKETEFRENILAQYLLKSQSSALQALLHWLSIFELPVPERSLRALSQQAETTALLRQAQQISLIDFYPAFYGTEEAHYRLAAVLKPLIGKIAKEQTALAAAQLYKDWRADGYGELQALELIRLGFEGEQEEIARTVGDQISNRWIHGNRYRDAKHLCERILKKYPTDHKLQLNMARAKIVLGEIEEAIQYLEEARENCPPDQDNSQSTILFYLAQIYLQRGEVDQALQMYEQAKAILERIGDEKGKSATLHSMAYIYRQRGEVDQALQMYEQAMQIDERIGDVHGMANTAIMMGQLFAYGKQDFDTGLQLMNHGVNILQQLKVADLGQAEEIRNEMFIDHIKHQLGPEKLQHFLQLIQTQGGDTAMAYLAEERKKLPEG